MESFDLKIVECVPNFSEGRRMNVVNAICDAARNVAGVSVLGCESDASHNRMVLTFIGSPERVKIAALESSSVAIKLIDLNNHKGEHPRMGAVDVVPFIPLQDSSLEECVTLSQEFASEYSNVFNVPVFLYEAAAKRPERKNLADVRKGEFEGLRDLIGKDPARRPDYGPSSIHPTAGATAVGARAILIAYNVNLDTNDLSIARSIAHRIRARDGGLPSVKALGFELAEKKMVQVSMNLVDYKTTSILRTFERVTECARERGVDVVDSEIVGLVPLDALIEGAKAKLKLANFEPDQIIENGIIQLLASGREHDKSKNMNLEHMSLGEFAERVASSDPVPGGGSVAAYSGVMAASLVSMVCNLTIGKKGYEAQNASVSRILLQARTLSSKLQDLSNRDSIAYSKVSMAFALPKTLEEEKARRSDELNAALREATDIPVETMIASLQVLKLAKELMEIGNRNAMSDAETAFELARASIMGAWSNVRINLESLSNDREFVSMTTERVKPILSELD